MSSYQTRTSPTLFIKCWGSVWRAGWSTCFCSGASDCLLLDSEGKTKTLGLVVMAIALCVEAYSLGLSFVGRSLDVEAPGFKLLFLLPFVWLLLESRKPASQFGERESISL